MFHVILGDDYSCWKGGITQGWSGVVGRDLCLGECDLISIDSREVVGFNAQGR